MLLRTTLLLHGIYFLIWSVTWEFLLPYVGPIFGYSAVLPPAGTIATQVAAGTMASFGVFLIILSRNQKINKYFMIPVMVQIVLNLIHDAVWLANPYPKPLLILDTLVIGIFFVLYLISLKRKYYG